jgi:hypothetical protein
MAAGGMLTVLKTPQMRWVISSADANLSRPIGKSDTAHLQAGTPAWNCFVCLRS